MSLQMNSSGMITFKLRIPLTSSKMVPNFLKKIPCMKFSIDDEIWLEVSRNQHARHREMCTWIKISVDIIHCVALGSNHMPVFLSSLKVFITTNNKPIKCCIWLYTFILWQRLLRIMSWAHHFSVFGLLIAFFWPWKHKMCVMKFRHSIYNSDSCRESATTLCHFGGFVLFQFLATDAWLMFTIQDYLLWFLCEINEATAVSSLLLCVLNFVAGYCRANAIVCRKWYAFSFFDTIINFRWNFSLSYSHSLSFIFKQKMPAIHRPSNIWVWHIFFKRIL